MRDYLMFLGKDDPTVLKAQEILDKGESFPDPPTPVPHPRSPSPCTPSQSRAELRWTELLRLFFCFVRACFFVQKSQGIR